MIKVNRHYQTIGAPAAGNIPAVPPETVRVTGFEDVPVGIQGSVRWPPGIESWCRVMTSSGMILMRPDSLSEIPSDCEYCNASADDGCDCCQDCGGSDSETARPGCPTPEGHCPPIPATKSAECHRVLEAGGDHWA